MVHIQIKDVNKAIRMNFRIKIPNLLVEITVNNVYSFYIVQTDFNPSIFCFDLELHLSKLISSLSGCPICP